jgi:hypothetical protein
MIVFHPNYFPTYAYLPMKLVDHVARIGEVRNAYKILVGKPEGKRSLGRRRCRWKDNIRTDLRETEWDIVNWIHVVQDRDQWRALVNTVKNLVFP